MKRFDQVRLIADPTKYGQIAAVREQEDTEETGPLCDLNVQWAGEEGDPTCHDFEEVRLETFLEFLFMRKTIGRMNGMLAAFCVFVWAAMLVPAPVISMSFVAFFFLVQYIYFKGILR